VEGFSLIERIRKGIKPGDLPVLVYTGHDLMPEASMVPEALSPEDEALLASKTVLVVDDDIRNIFSLTAALERRQMKVLNAESGQQAIDTLSKREDVDIVLMDIMMPKMDGYETMRAIRGVERLRDLPILALTAKAMKGDREKCIEAGATDYIAKPVDIAQLLAMLRLWLKK
jgi:CheY-like chemotaxis protein